MSVTTMLHRKGDSKTPKTSNPFAGCSTNYGSVRCAASGSERMFPIELLRTVETHNGDLRVAVFWTDHHGRSHKWRGLWSKIEMSVQDNFVRLAYPGQKTILIEGAPSIATLTA